MNKSLNVFLSVAIVFLSVATVLLIAFFLLRDSEKPFSNSVEIVTTPGTKVFAKLTEGEEQFLNSVPELDNGEPNQITVDVPVNADVILRYNNQEEIITYEDWQAKKKISFDFNAAHSLISVDFNVNPWAYVFIQLPDSEDFIEPRRADYLVPPDPDRPNLTPIRKGLKLPIGTTIKLVYEGREKVFSYETWKDNPRISHDF